MFQPGASTARVGVVVNAVVIVIWAMSRTTGLPIGSQPWVPEPVGFADLLATSFELGLIGLLLPTLFRERFAQALDSPLPIQRAFVLAAFMFVAISLLTAIALVPPAFEFLAF